MKQYINVLATDIPAMLSGTKTQIRVIAECQSKKPTMKDFPFGGVGSTIGVKEPFYVNGSGMFYAGDETEIIGKPGTKWEGLGGKHPAQHLPDWASRYTIRIKKVSIQKLSDITDSEAMSEGVTKCDAGYYMHGYTTPAPGACLRTARGAFLNRWLKVHGFDSIDQDPYLFVISFSMVAKD